MEEGARGWPKFKVKKEKGGAMGGGIETKPPGNDPAGTSQMSQGKGREQPGKARRARRPRHGTSKQTNYE
jgi:hypothetical protein